MLIQLKLQEGLLAQDLTEESREEGIWITTEVRNIDRVQTRVVADDQPGGDHRRAAWRADVGVVVSNIDSIKREEVKRDGQHPQLA